ncbi:SixA phosphatase family protein [Actinospongicola halichondriae]|uniref:SixA phosphatase family protein n=1 Tax=Actinospongicola halichondriae TaxID=3236844 RepID=UPI003D4A677F
MALLIVRHGHAGERRSWSGDDRVRPLSERGRKQAAALAADLVQYEPRRILTSPTTRCRETVEPLGAAVDVPVQDDDRLFEGPSASAIESLLDDAARKKTIVLSSHGDVIPALLHELENRGMTHDDRLVWQKASTWVIEYSKADGWGAGRYLAPPSGR